MELEALITEIDDSLDEADVPMKTIFHASTSVAKLITAVRDLRAIVIEQQREIINLRNRVGANYPIVWSEPPKQD
jgi:hypothetical protein